MNDLNDFSRNFFTPTRDQEKALSKLNSFFHSENKCFILKGYAGTGKTYLVKCITEYLVEAKLDPILLAPTGRAARILHQKTQHQAMTIHKAIYNLNEIDEVDVEKSDCKKVKYKFRYNLNHIVLNTNNIYLIDEASMISDTYNENDFFIFGSGRLLKDLIDYISPGNIGRNNKVIFIGDSAQLPPVSDNKSVALDSDYLKTTFNIETDQYELTEVVEQESMSGILSIATYIRNQLNDNLRNSFEINTNVDDIEYLNPKDVAEIYVTENPEMLIDKSVVINYSNKSSLEYNLSIRQKLLRNKDIIETGDLLIICQNNYNYDVELLNGMFVKVTEVGGLEIKTGIKSYNEAGGECRVNHQFRKIKILVPFNDKEVEVDCLILENFLNSPYPTLDYSENIALYIDFKMRNANLRPKSIEFRDQLKKDPYFNAIRVKYGYSITCHKAQGGEWESAIVNMDISQNPISDNFLRWVYTAFTRASSKLYIFNVPQRNQFSLLQYYPASINHPFVADDPILFLQIKKTENIHKVSLKFEIENEEKFKKEKLVEVYAVAEYMKCEILSRIKHQYLEIYVIGDTEKKAGINFWYNSNHKFTKIGIADNLTTDKIFASKLKEIFEQPKRICFESKKSGEPIKSNKAELDIESIFTADYSPLKNLCYGLLDILIKNNISIYDIKHYQYHEIYQFKRDNEKASVRFYFDRLNRFTKAEPLIEHCNSNLILKDLQVAIDELKKKYDPKSFITKR